MSHSTSYVFDHNSLTREKKYREKKKKQLGHEVTKISVQGNHSSKKNAGNGLYKDQKIALPLGRVCRP